MSKEMQGLLFKNSFKAVAAEHETRRGALLNVGLCGAVGARMRPTPSRFPHIQRCLEPQVWIVRHGFLWNNLFFLSVSNLPTYSPADPLHLQFAGPSDNLQHRCARLPSHQDSWGLSLERAQKSSLSRGCLPFSSIFLAISPLSPRSVVQDFPPIFNTIWAKSIWFLLILYDDILCMVKSFYELLEHGHETNLI